MAEDEKVHIRFSTIIEVLGKPKEHVEKSLRDYIAKIRETGDFIILKESYAPAKEQGNMFSVFVELEIVAKNLSQVIGFCFDYMPSSLEIIKPDHLSVRNFEISAVLNDLQAKLHTVDMVAKKLSNENTFLRRNLNNALKNNILIILAVKKTATVDELSKLGGIHESEIGNFIDELTKEAKIKKENNSYLLA